MFKRKRSGAYIILVFFSLSFFNFSLNAQQLFRPRLSWINIKGTEISVPQPVIDSYNSRSSYPSIISLMSRISRIEAHFCKSHEQHSEFKDANLDYYIYRNNGEIDRDTNNSISGYGEGCYDREHGHTATSTGHYKARVELDRQFGKDVGCELFVGCDHYNGDWDNNYHVKEKSVYVDNRPPELILYIKNLPVNDSDIEDRDLVRIWRSGDKKFVTVKDIHGLGIADEDYFFVTHTDNATCSIYAEDDFAIKSLEMTDTEIPNPFGEDFLISTISYDEAHANYHYFTIGNTPVALSTDNTIRLNYKVKDFCDNESKVVARYSETETNCLPFYPYTCWPWHVEGPILNNGSITIHKDSGDPDTSATINNAYANTAAQANLLPSHNNYVLMTKSGNIIFNLSISATDNGSPALGIRSVNCSINNQNYSVMSGGVMDANNRFLTRIYTGNASNISISKPSVNTEYTVTTSATDLVGNSGSDESIINVITQPVSISINSPRQKNSARKEIRFTRSLSNSTFRGRNLYKNNFSFLYQYNGGSTQRVEGNSFTLDNSYTDGRYRVRARVEDIFSINRNSPWVTEIYDTHTPEIRSIKFYIDNAEVPSTIYTNKNITVRYELSDNIQLSRLCKVVDSTEENVFTGFPGSPKYNQGPANDYTYTFEETFEEYDQARFYRLYDKYYTDNFNGQADERMRPEIRIDKNPPTISVIRETKTYIEDGIEKSYFVLKITSVDNDPGGHQAVNTGFYIYKSETDGPGSGVNPGDIIIKNIASNISTINIPVRKNLQNGVSGTDYFVNSPDPAYYYAAAYDAAGNISDTFYIGLLEQELPVLEQDIEQDDTVTVEGIKFFKRIKVKGTLILQPKALVVGKTSESALIFTEGGKLISNASADNSEELITVKGALSPDVRFTGSGTDEKLNRAWDGLIFEYDFDAAESRLVNMEITHAYAGLTFFNTAPRRINSMEIEDVTLRENFIGIHISNCLLETGNILIINNKYGIKEEKSSGENREGVTLSNPENLHSNLYGNYYDSDVFLEHDYNNQ